LFTASALAIGYMVGNLLYNFEIKLIQGVDPNTLYWGTIMVMCLIAFFIVSLIKKFIIILATSIIGAYAAIRGISFIYQGFPDETYVMKLMKKNEYNQLNRIFSHTVYIYLSGIILLTLVGVCLQYRLFGADEDDDKPKEKSEEVKVPS